MNAATLKLTNEQLADLLCTAFEGGSNYWIEWVDTSGQWPTGAEFFHECPVYNGSITLVFENDEPITGKGKRYPLTRQHLDTGLQVMAAKYPKHFADIVADNHDADTADVFLQCCLFGETIFA